MEQPILTELDYGRLIALALEAQDRELARAADYARRGNMDSYHVGKQLANQYADLAERLSAIRTGVMAASAMWERDSGN